MSISKTSDFSRFLDLTPRGKYIFVKSNLVHLFFEALLLENYCPNPEEIFIVHGDDTTISSSRGQLLSITGFKIMAVNWLGDQSLIQSLPIGIPTLDRLGGVKREVFDEYLRTYDILSKTEIDRDIHLYSNFDITTNLPLRKKALLASLHTHNSYMPMGRMGIIDNLEILRRSKYVLSPPGAGPDCFRTWEAIYLGAIPIVLRSHWPFGHLDLPVMVIDGFDDLEQKIADFENQGHVRNESWENYFLLP